MAKVRDIMTANIITVDETASVKEAAALMSEYNIGSIPVVSTNRNIVGIVTDRDITLRTTAQGENPETPVSEVMTAQQIVQVSADMSVEQAAELMAEQQIRRLPVTENEQIIGMVALGDLAVEDQYADEAETALQSISTPSAPQQ